MDRVVHFEIPFDDKARAMRFYSEIFGWRLADIPEADYTLAYAAKTDENHMVQEKGAINGGLFQRSDAAKGPMLVIGVASIDATIERVIAAGGAVVTPKRPIPNGSYARVSDCEGNVIGLAADESHS
ncbi:MAG: VOC family protein [Spirochaetes bacterium]|nr:VOC family protein [Spirochaetota bacterium]